MPCRQTRLLLRGPYLKHSRDVGSRRRRYDDAPSPTLTTDPPRRQLATTTRLLKKASSGKVTRHRLDRGGDRQANQALWRIVMVRMVSDPDPRLRRTAYQG